jgi:tRNA A37 threonylcarbamoyladenosine dehydratase
MQTDYATRFSALARLHGAAGLERLRAAHVCVVGVGGVGSWAVEALARSGIGALTLIDLDDVCVTNVNRQLPALEGTFGRPKIDVLAERVRLINPDARIATHAEFFTAASATHLLEPRYDFVADAIDRAAHKCQLIAACRERGLPVITSGGAGGKRDATAVRVADLAHSVGDDLLRQVRRQLRGEFGFPRDVAATFGMACVFSAEKPVFPWAEGVCRGEPEPGSTRALDCASGFGTACHVTAAFGLAMAGEIVNRIAEGKRET